MPRGVYDRSKMKTKTAAAPAAKKAPAAPKGKPGRKPGAQSTKGSGGNVQTVQSTRSSGGDALELFATVRSNLDTLTAVADKFGHALVQEEVKAHVGILSDLRKKVFGSNEKTASAPAEAATTSNGTTASAPSFPPSVPMPAAPIPPIAAH